MVFVHSLLAYRAHLGRVGYSQQNFMPEMERGKERERERERASVAHPPTHSPNPSTHAHAPGIVTDVSSAKLKEGRKEGRNKISGRMGASIAAPFVGLAIAISLRLGRLSPPQSPTEAFRVAVDTGRCRHSLDHAVAQSH